MIHILHISRLIVCILVTNSVVAQQVYTSAHYGAPVTQQLYSSHFTGFTVADIIADGENVTWDVSALVASDLSLSEVVTRDAGMDIVTFTTACALSGINVFTCLTIWNNTQQVWQSQDTQILVFFPVTDVQRFQRKTQTQLLETFFGFTLDFGGAPTPFAVVYQSPDTVLTFPMSFGENHSSQIEWGLNLVPAGLDIVYESNQHRTSSVDGWGTLITPFDTLTDVLRVRAVIARNDLLTTDTLTLPIDISQVEYTWYDTAYGLPVMIATGILTDTSETINNVSFVVESFCADHTWSASTDTDSYVLDSAGIAEVAFHLSQPNADSYTWDFGDGSSTTSTGEVVHVYSSGGTYTVTVTGCMTNCLPWNSCIMQTFTLEIIDTTSALRLPDTDAYGIRIFPNPATDYLSVAIPAGIGSLVFTLMDVHGRTLASGILQSGSVTPLTLGALPGGIYLLRLHDPVNGIVFGARRIVIAQKE